jgi:hypothetical protein
VNFGDLINTLFKASAIKYDPQTSKTDLYFLQHTDGYNGKFSDEKPRLTIFDKNIPNITIYSVLWLLKGMFLIILSRANKT